MQAHNYPFIDLAVHAAIRNRFANGDAVAVLSGDLGEVLWANGAAAKLFGFDTIYDVLDEGLSGQPVTIRQIRSALSGHERTGKPQSFMMRLARGFSRAMTPAGLETIVLPDGAKALLVTSQAGSVLAPGARAQQIISGFEGTGTHVAVLDAKGVVLAASRTFDALGLASADIGRMVTDVAGENDRLVKRIIQADHGKMPAAIGKLADDPLLHLLFAVDPASEDETRDAPGAVIPNTDAVFASATVIADQSQDASASDQTGETLGSTPNPEADTVPVRADSFDAERVREELEECANSAPDQDDVPPPFAEARGFETRIDSDRQTGEANQAGGSSETGDENRLDQQDQQPDHNSAFGLRSNDVRASEVQASEVPVTEVEAKEVEATETQAGEAHSAGASMSSQSAGEEPAYSDTAGETGSGDAGPAEPGPVADAATPEMTPPTDTFRFDSDAKPARFVWKIGRDGMFSEVSPEFARAVGPNAADIIGRRFPDLARVFNLDPDHVIADLLNRRDTWSGKTVYWPIQGTDLVTPVDLAALPTYTRDRQFDGFRGFGIVRSGETRKDPEALGLALVPGAALTELHAADPGDAGSENSGDGSLAADHTTKPGEKVDDVALEELELERDIADLARIDGAEVAEPHQDHDEPETAEPPENIDTVEEHGDTTDTDPFRGEKPSIRLVETPMRRESDKVIDLEARRSRPGRDGLSAGEQAAFREIGARLNETSGPGSTPEANPDEDAGNGTEKDADDRQDTPARDQPAFGKRQSPFDDAPSETRDIDVTFEDRATGETEIEASGPDGAVSAADLSESDHDRHNRDGIEPHGSDPSDATIADPEPHPGSRSQSAERAQAPLPSAFAIPDKPDKPDRPGGPDGQLETTGLDAELIDALPAPLLVHAGDELIHANPEFLEFTGYASLEALSLAGGLDHLIERPGEATGLEDNALIVRRGNADLRKVTARLRSISWAGGQALLLALTPIADNEAAGSQPNEAPDLFNTPKPDGEDVDALAVEALELRSILETATDGVVTLERDGTIRSMNSSACALFNYDATDTVNQPFAMLFAHESQRAVMEYIGGLAEHGVSSVLNDGREVIGREASGGFLPLFMTIGQLSGSDGLCAVLRDITQWKRTEEELRTAKRTAETANSHKSDFLARVSHEIRTPLNAIIGFSEMMVEERFGPIGSPRYLEYAHDIGSSGKHVLDIVNDLLDISKIEAGQVDMEFTAVSLNDHVAESVSLLQPMANSQRVIIRSSLSASVPEVVADQRSIKQIALNLLSNAIRFTPSGGQIVVSTSYEASGNVVIRIRDTGIGMNRKELEQAMKPFGQVGPGPRQRADGTGLGLPLTKAMVEANRASFDIVSTPGEGTLVSISFPPQRVLAD